MTEFGDGGGTGDRTEQRTRQGTEWRTGDSGEDKTGHEATGQRTRQKPRQRTAGRGHDKMQDMNESWTRDVLG